MAARGILGEFAAGVGMLLRGFGWWRRRPGLMALGLLPAAIAGALLLAALIALGLTLPGTTIAVTPFAEEWPPFWSAALRTAVGTAVFGGALALAVVTYTALALLVGEPFYDRIWRAVETDLHTDAGDAGGAAPQTGLGFWRQVADSAGLVARGLAVALTAALIGLIPLVGGVAGAVVGVVLTGLLLADELSSRALGARGITPTQRRALLRARRARALGFGIATQLCFLVPLGAILVMPAAVAGSTLLARSVLPREDVGAPA